MLKKGEYHYARDTKNREAKLARHRRFLEKQKSQAILKNRLTFTIDTTPRHKLPFPGNPVNTKIVRKFQFPNNFL
jgi:hypothetical protein